MIEVKDLWAVTGELDSADRSRTGGVPRVLSSWTWHGNCIIPGSIPFMGLYVLTP